MRKINTHISHFKVFTLLKVTKVVKIEDDIYVVGKIIALYKVTVISLFALYKVSVISLFALYKVMVKSLSTLCKV